MRAIRILFFFSVFLTCILSCASIARKDTLYVNLTDSSRFVLLPTEEIEQAMDMLQFQSAEFMGQNYFFQAWVKADENAIEIVIFNDLGASIGELTYRNGAVHFSSTVFPRTVINLFKPEYIVADFQLCFYDPLVLGKSLNNIGLVLVVNDSGRRILSGNDVIIEIKKTKNTVELVNHLREYAYIMEGDFHGIQ